MTMADELIIVELAEQPIELCKLLKVANLVGGGGEAKIVISEGYVYVNNEVEYQKRKKIYDQDIVEFNGEQILVECSAPVTIKTKSVKPAAPATKDSSKNKNHRQQHPSKKNSSNQAKVPTTPEKNPKGRRKPINF
ncbi:RNA-binding S4 domain-containing protein [Thalassotalea fusca]